MCRRVPLDGSCSQETIIEAVTDAVRYANYHKHTHTCKKGGRGGGHGDCRMGFDLPLVDTTGLLDECTFAVQRDKGMIVPFIFALMLACAGNHLMQFTCEGGRWLRQTLLWNDAQAASPEDKVR
jgi:hypothetical protein